MSLVTEEHKNTIEAYELLFSTLADEDLGAPFIEVGEDPEDEVTEGFNAGVHIYPDDENNMYIQSCWDETPLKAVQGLINTLKEQGFMNEY